MDIVKNIIIEEVRKDMDSQRTLIKNLTSDLKDQREELEVAKRLLTNEQRQEFDDQVRKLRENRSNPQDIRHRSLENVFANTQINDQTPEGSVTLLGQMYRNVSESNITYQSPLPQLTTTQSMYGISSSHSPSQRGNATPPISMHTPPISVGSTIGLAPTHVTAAMASGMHHNLVQMVPNHPMAMQAAAAQQAAVQQAQAAQQQKQKQQQPQNNNQTVQQISVSGRFMVGIGIFLGFGLGLYLKGQYFNSVLGLPL